MQAICFLAFGLSLFSVAQASTMIMSGSLGRCMSDLVTEELSLSYNYLQLSSKFGTSSAYPGFSSLFTKLSDEDSSKAHELVKFLALRRAHLTRLVAKEGVNIRSEVATILNITQGLTQAHEQNRNVWKTILRCHDEANTVRDPNTQDYLESHFLDHHVEIEKLLNDLSQRINDAKEGEKKLIIFMVDEELLQTYGDRRKDIFS